MEQKFSNLGLHMGHAIIAIANTYKFVLEIVLENIQNALDSGARNVWIRINLKGRTFSIHDDGDGVSKDSFEKALGEVCKSQKVRSKMGRFGRGLISPLGKCSRFTFTSSPKGRSEYREWTFVGKDIEQCSDSVLIPCRRREDITSNPNKHDRGMTLVNWNTSVVLADVTADARIGQISFRDLAESVLAKFGNAMRKLDATVHITFVNEKGEEKSEALRATTCTGEPLDKVVLGPKESETTFVLYRALKAGGARKGKVVIGETDDDFRFTLSEFSRSVDMVSPETMSALVSGVFEGEITTKAAKLDPSRTRFEEGEGVLKLCMALDEWFKRHGNKYMEEIELDKEDELYQKIGAASIKHIENLIMHGGEDFKRFRELLDSLAVGNIGTNHFKPRRKDVVGETNENVIRVKDGGSSSGTPSGGGAKTPETDHPEDHPFTVAGPLGRRRKLVKGGSTGLQFEYAETERKADLWSFDAERGVLTFNTRHAAWLICKDRGEKHLRQFQEYIAISALTIETMSEDEREHLRVFVEDQAKAMAFEFTESDAFKGRTQLVS